MNTEKNGYEQQNAFLYTSIANNAMVNGRLLYHMKCLLYTNDEILRKAGLYNASYNTFLITRGHHIPAIKTGWNVILAAILIVIVAISRPFSAGRTCVKIVHYRIMVHTGHITLCVNLYENAIKSAVWQSFFLYPVTVITNFLHYFHCIIIIVMEEKEGAMSLDLSWLAIPKKNWAVHPNNIIFISSNFFFRQMTTTTTISILSTLFTKFLLWTCFEHSFFFRRKRGKQSVEVNELCCCCGDLTAVRLLSLSVF